MENKKLIYIIEDEEGHSFLIKRSFINYEEEFELEYFDTLKTAYIRLNEQLPDLIIIDWSLPDGKANELIVKDELYLKVPIIVMTSFAIPQNQELLLNYNVDSYLEKSSEMFFQLPISAQNEMEKWKLR